METLLPKKRTLIKHVLDTYEATTPDEWLEGMQWYSMAHLFAAEIAQGDTDKGAGVIAALSPNKRWTENMALAERACRSGVASGHVGDAVRKAQRILDGEASDDVLRGSKVRSFNRLIADPTNDFDVCLDRHAFDVAVGKVTDDQARKILERPTGYEYLADIYRNVADRLGILPSAAQAVTWVHWRNVKPKERRKRVPALA